MPTKRFKLFVISDLPMLLALDGTSLIGEATHICACSVTLAYEPFPDRFAGPLIL